MIDGKDKKILAAAAQVEVGMWANGIAQIAWMWKTGRVWPTVDAQGGEGRAKG